MNDTGRRSVARLSVDEATTRRYGEIIDDLNPFHFDAEFAGATPLGRPNVSGSLLVATVLPVIADHLPASASTATFRFRSWTYVGDPFAVEQVADRRFCAFGDDGVPRFEIRIR